MTFSQHTVAQGNKNTFVQVTQHEEQAGLTEQLVRPACGDDKVNDTFDICPRGIYTEYEYDTLCP